jgi:ribose transport system ATP-binding protein
VIGPNVNAIPCLQVESLTKSFSGVRALHEVSFTAYAGEVLGVVGENGSGKSTTMNILAGVLSRDSGTIMLDRDPYEPKTRQESERLGVAFIQQELNIFPNLTIAENVFLGRAPKRVRGLPFISRARMNAHAREFLQAVNLAVDPAESASLLSAGERQLLEIARALSTDARVVILDEPTTSLTQRETERLFEIVRRLCTHKLAVVYISHSLQDVLTLSSRVIVLRDGKVTRRFDNEGVTTDDLVIAMVGRSIDALFPERIALPRETPPALDVRGVGEPGVIDNISLQVRKGEIVGLAGLMGSGRSELARILFGLDRHSSGTVRMNGRLVGAGDLQSRLRCGVAFLTEDRRHDSLMMEASVAENMALAALPMYTRSSGVVAGSALTGAVQPLMQSLNLKCGNVRSMPVRCLSGGNQQKVVLVRWLLRKPTVFILDEPTRGVDVGAKEDIYRLVVEMAEGGTAILVISSELEELIGLCDRILVMRHGHIQTQYDRAGFKAETILKAAFGQGPVA